MTNIRDVFLTYATYVSYMFFTRTCRDMANVRIFPQYHDVVCRMVIAGTITVSAMGGATVEQWGQLVPTEMRLWGQNYVIAPPPLKFGEHAVKDINRKYCPHCEKSWRRPWFLLYAIGTQPDNMSPKVVRNRQTLFVRIVFFY